MMEWLRNLMIGRYGPDPLSYGLLVLFLLLSMTGQLTDVMFIRWLSLAPLAWCLFRILSRNAEKRSAENRVFLSLWNPVAAGVRGWIQRLRESKTHRFFRCPKCAQRLRVPKGRGKIEIICPKCGNRLVKKT